MKTKEKKHAHIWKYNTGGVVRVCEAPIPTIESCGKEERTGEETTNKLPKKSV